MTAILPRASADDRLLSLGAEFDRAFERYLWLIAETNKVRQDCEERLPTFGVPTDSPRWSRLVDQACSGWQDAARDAGEDVEAISRKIAAIPATTVSGLLVKAKTLPFEVGGRSDEDRQTAILHAFVDQVEAITYGRVAAC